MSKITFTERAFAEYLYWQSQDKKTLKRINALLKDISRSPYEGIGKPEGLKENLSGYWSRRIDDVNRLVYRIENDLIEVYSARDITTIEAKKRGRPMAVLVLLYLGDYTSSVSSSSSSSSSSARASAWMR